MIKKLHTGILLLDWMDIILISFSAGAMLAQLFQKYGNQTDRPDPIISELKKSSRKFKRSKSISMASTDGNALKLPLIRGGEMITGGISLAIKNKKFAAFLRTLLQTKQNQKLLKLLQICLAIINQSLTSGVGLRFGVGGCLNNTQVILLTLSGSLGGFLVGQIIANPLAAVLFPLAILFGRGVEEVADPYEKCRLLCKAAEDFHNNEHLMEMEKLNSLIEETSNKLQLPLDKVPLLSVKCVEAKSSISQRFRLRQLVESAKVKKRITHYNEFIKKFPECSLTLEEVVEKIPE
jgi:hypothetical protein